jgi:hypothetical protein
VRTSIPNSVPKARLNLAQDVSPGLTEKARIVPPGTAETSSPVFSRPSRGLVELFVSTQDCRPGLSSAVPSGLEQSSHTPSDGRQLQHHCETGSTNQTRGCSSLGQSDRPFAAAAGDTAIMRNRGRQERRG